MPTTSARKNRQNVKLALLASSFSGFSIRCIFFTYLFGFDTHFSSPDFSEKNVFRCRPQHVSWRYINLIALAPQFYSWKESRLWMFSTATRFNYMRSQNLILFPDRRVAYFITAHSCPPSHQQTDMCARLPFIVEKWSQIARNNMLAARRSLSISPNSIIFWRQLSLFNHKCIYNILSHSNKREIDSFHFERGKHMWIGASFLVKFTLQNRDNFR